MATDSNQGSATLDVQDLDERVRDLADRVETLERLFSDRIIADQSQAQQAHKEKASEDARELMDAGEVRRMPIDKTPGMRDRGKTEAFAYSEEGIATFIDPSGHQLNPNDVVKVRITRVRDNACEAVVLDIVNEE